MTSKRKPTIAAKKPQGFPEALATVMGKDAHAEWHKSFRESVGRRLKAAREFSGMQQIDVARRMGYTAATHVNEWEKGVRLPGPEKLALLIKCYGTSADFIYGLRDDPDPDPVTGVQYLMAAHMRQQIERLCTDLARVSASAVREMSASNGEVLSLCRTVLEADGALAKARAHNQEWFDDEVRGGAALVLRLQTASDLARQAVKKIERANRCATVRGLAHADKMLSTNGSVQVGLFTGIPADEHHQANGGAR